ncbi:MAG: homocysteine biosynthesis protein [Candidatus Aegiribacteria sp.]|nr:homocysteine biosynthesis protein [Candidatus Aegiribacteria sp.]
MKRTWEEINDKIDRGNIVVITAEEMTELSEREGVKEACRQVDVVTTGTFSPMCSSGLLINTGHHAPRINYKRAWLNGVPAYAGIAAVDLYLGATAQRENGGTPSAYGGGHVIEDLVSGRQIQLQAEGHGTDCYPGRSAEGSYTIDDLENAILLNPRNCYQNYNVAVNASSPGTIHTYMGPLLPDMRNAAYSSAGQLSPLLNDPEYRTIGIGSRVFLGGGIGYVTFMGTQHNPDTERTPGGVPNCGAGTLALCGDLRHMSPEYLRGVCIKGYGVSLAVGVGIAIPILDEEMAFYTGVSDADIPAPVIDYSSDYPGMSGDILGRTNYKELRSGEIKVMGKQVRTISLSSYSKARKIAVELKNRIRNGSFRLTVPVAPLME